MGLIAAIPCVGRCTAATLFRMTHERRACVLPCASVHIGCLRPHAIVPKQTGCIGHPTAKGTCHAHHRRSQTPGHLTRLPCRHFGSPAPGRVRPYHAKLVSVLAEPNCDHGLRASGTWPALRRYPLTPSLAVRWLRAAPTEEVEAMLFLDIGTMLSIAGASFAGVVACSGLLLLLA